MAKKKLIYVAVLACLLSTLIRPVNAAEVGLGVFPPIIEVTTTPPASIPSQITIENLSDKEVTLSILLKQFHASPQYNGEVEFEASDEPDEAYQELFANIQFFVNDNRSSKFMLDPHETKKVLMHIEIDKNISKNDYYFSVIFLSTPENNQGNISQLPAGIATNVLLSIGPQGPTTGFISNFSVPVFIEKGPVPFSLLIKNTSDHFIHPTGKVVISNMWGKSLGKLDVLPQAILAKSGRYLVDRDQASISARLEENLKRSSLEHKVLLWNESHLFGIYKAKLDIELGEGGPRFTRTIHFVSFPYSLFIGLIVIITITLGIYLRVKKKI